MFDYVAEALGRIKRSLAQLLDRETIRTVCCEVGHEWRDRRLDPATTLHLFILQVLNGNTACRHLPHLSDLGFTDTAYCQARTRLPIAVFRKMLGKLCVAQQSDVDASDRWCGHRTFLLDGSSFSMPDTAELREHFGLAPSQRAGCGFPVAHLLALFHASSGLLMEVLAAVGRTHDLSRAALMHPKLETGDVLVADRGFCSFPHLALLAQRGVFALFRMHQRVLVDFTPGRAHGGKGQPRSRWIRSLGPNNQLVEWSKPKQKPDWMTAEELAALPERLVVREVRYRVDRPGFRTREITLVTTLLDPELYPAAELAQLYRTRWRVECELRNLKTTMKMDVLRCKTVDGIHKELLIFAMVFNLVRLVMLAAARQQAVPVERISFIDAVRWLCSARPGKRLGKLHVLPNRPNRVEPRVRKRRPKQFPLMRQPRAILQARLLGISA